MFEPIAKQSSISFSYLGTLAKSQYTVKPGTSNISLSDLEVVVDVEGCDFYLSLGCSTKGFPSLFLKGRGLELDVSKKVTSQVTFQFQINLTCSKFLHPPPSLSGLRVSEIGWRTIFYGGESLL